MGDAYPNSSKLPKGEYTLQLYLRYEPFHGTAKHAHTRLHFALLYLAQYFRLYLSCHN